MKLEITKATDTKINAQVNDHFEQIKPTETHGKIWRVIGSTSGLRLVSVKSGRVWDTYSLWSGEENNFIPWKGQYTITVE